MDDIDITLAPRLLGEKRDVFLARLLLRFLEVLTAKDRNQDLLAIYNVLKPECEASLRTGRRRPTGDRS